MARSVWDEDLMTSEVVLPPREFLFTLTQIRDMLQCSENYLNEKILYFQGRTHFSAKGRMKAINIAPPDEKPLWRVSETDFKLWMRSRGVSFSQPVNVQLRKKSTRVGG